MDIREPMHKINCFTCSGCAFTVIRKGDSMDIQEPMHEGNRCPCSECEFTVIRKGGASYHVISLHQETVIVISADSQQQRKGVGIIMIIVFFK